jgi:hypothetical protein
MHLIYLINPLSRNAPQCGLLILIFFTCLLNARQSYSSMGIQALQLNGLTNQIRIKSVSGSNSGIVKSEPHSVSVLVVCLSKALPTQWKHVGSNPARVCLSGLDFFVKSF